MGRIKSLQIKRTARKLFEEHKSSFTTNFEENKKNIEKFVEASKKIRNSIAGYVTKLAKKSK
ncbi:30S ribosomal protein S17e [Candidatus Pacearchaeota archaeon ex4484_26]|nr:MAG: 30S ribosomal protein S17e [Candidatus Pacearchaeota archaeon ex4484_26]